MNALNTKKLLAASAFGLWLSGSFTVSYASPVADTVELAQAAPDEGTAAGPAEEGQDGGQRGVEQQQQEKAKRAARQQQQDAERAAKEEQRQQKDAERAERKQQQEAERAAKDQKQQEEAERAARKQQGEAERAQQQQQQEAERATREQERQQKAAERAERKQQQEAERAAKEQKQQEEAERAARKQQGEAEPAQQQQQQEAERATREQEREQREAERAQRKQHQETERAAKEQEKQQEEAERAAKKRQEDAEKAQTKAEERDEDQKAKADAERVRQEAAKAKVKAEKKQPDAATAGQEPDGGATRPKVEQAQPARPETDRSRADLKAQDGREGLRERRFEPKDEKQAVEQIKEERAEADAEFERAKREAAQKPAEFGALEGREIRSQEFERIRKQRRERVEDVGQRAVIEEPDDRRIILEKDRAFVRHDEERRFERFGKRIKHERRKDGTTLSIYLSLGGVEIITVEDEDGRLLRRSRRDRDGHEIVLVDNRRFYESRPRRGSGEVFVTLPPARVRIPRSRYIVDYNEASEEDIYEALVAPPVERLDRRYSLDEVRYGYGLRERMRRVDLDAINFAFGSWEVEESQYEKLERMARVIKRILKRNPDEMFLIEGHTDAVGSDIDNLSLSDRRAESVAIILSDSFRVPPENLTTQGYGEQYLKVLTYGPSRENRRVSVRRITPLLSQAD
jgi:outer membrane protein OmpA-like peptidoglycan-associated protein